VSEGGREGGRAGGKAKESNGEWVGLASRRTAGLILCGLALAPRVTIFYLLFFARQPLFLVVGPGIYLLNSSIPKL
jgi:hypothetical protein